MKQKKLGKYILFPVLEQVEKIGSWYIDTAIPATFERSPPLPEGFVITDRFSVRTRRWLNFAFMVSQASLIVPSQRNPPGQSGCQETGALLSREPSNP
jgi:hypothetical protein